MNRQQIVIDMDYLIRILKNLAASPLEKKFNFLQVTWYMQIYHGLTPLCNKHGLPNKNFKIFNSISLRKWKINFFYKLSGICIWT